MRGLAVEVSPDPATAGSSTITVTAGYALAPNGDQLVVCQSVSRSLALGAKRWFVAVRYDEQLVDPVPAARGQDGMQFSAVEETYAVEIVEAVPDEQWVVLAAVELDPSGQAIIDTSTRHNLS